MPAPCSLVAAPFSSGETRAWAVGEEPMVRVHAVVTMLLGDRKLLLIDKHFVNFALNFRFVLKWILTHSL